MAEDQEASPFLEIFCKSSGKIRRFGKGTEVQFALELINQKLDAGAPLATYIEAVKDGEEPVSFGPGCILFDYGNGWKLQTATTEGFGMQNGVEPTLEPFPANQGYESVNDLEPIHEQPPTTEGVKNLSGVESASVRCGNANVSATLPNTEPLSLIQLSYESDGEQHKQVIEDSIGPDTTNAFATTTIFAGSEELVDWCKKTGVGIGVVVVIGKSDHAGRNRRPRVKLVCERSGVYRPSSSNSSKRTRNVVSKKCGCPFNLKGYQRDDKGWEMKVICGRHNHDLCENLKGPSFIGKLSPEEEAVVTELSKAGAKPRHVLKILKRRFPNTQSSKGTIYSYRKRHKLSQSQLKLQGEVVEGLQ